MCDVMSCELVKTWMCEWGKMGGKRAFAMCDIMSWRKKMFK
jgi:hypothetical protein